MTMLDVNTRDYKAYSICTHSTAVAEYTSNLEKYVKEAKRKRRRS